MNQFTERHHAFIAATFYQLLNEAFGARGTPAFILCTQRYAEQRGSRMAQRAIKDGQPLTFLTYQRYGEWKNSEAVIAADEHNQREILRYTPDLEIKITRCPWAMQFKDMGAVGAGVEYCRHLDQSIVRGFNPYLVFDVPQTMHKEGHCIQIMRNSGVLESDRPQKIDAYLRDFDFHCGHIFKTFSELCCSIFDEQGMDVSNQALAAFKREYGEEMTDTLLGFFDHDFNLLD